MELCEKHQKNKDLFCSMKECMQTICLKCLKDHSDHGKNILLIEDMIENIEQKQKSSLLNIESFESFKEKFEKIIQKNTEFSENYEEKLFAFHGKIENQLQLFVEHISKNLKVQNELKDSKKTKLTTWISESNKAIDIINIHIKELKNEINVTKNDIFNKNFINIYENISRTPLGKIIEFNELMNSYFETCENDPTEFFIGEFINFAHLDPVQQKLLNQNTSELKNIENQLSEKKAKYLELEENLVKLNNKIFDQQKFFEENQKKIDNNLFTYVKNFEDSNNKNFEKYQQKMDDSSLNLKKVEKLMNDNFEKMKNSMKKTISFFDKIEENEMGVKNTTNFLLSQKLSNLNFIALRFNKSFTEIEFSLNGSMCCFKNKRYSSENLRFCLADYPLSSNSYVKIHILFKPENNDADFGLIEKYEFNPLKNHMKFRDIINNEHFYIEKSGEVSKNLEGISHEIQKPTQFSIVIIHNQINIYSKDRSINLKGTLKNKLYYFAVSSRLDETSVQILNFICSD